MLEVLLDGNKKYDELCANIFGMNEKIRFVGILDNSGKLIAGGMREGVEPLEDEIHEKRWFHQIAIRKEMSSMFEKVYGKVIYIFANREKIKQLTFYIGDKILVISIQPNLESSKVIELAEDILS